MFAILNQSESKQQMLSHLETRLIHRGRSLHLDDQANLPEIPLYLHPHDNTPTPCKPCHIALGQNGIFITFKPITGRDLATLASPELADELSTPAMAKLLREIALLLPN